MYIVCIKLQVGSVRVYLTGELGQVVQATGPIREKSHGSKLEDAGVASKGPVKGVQESTVKGCNIPSTRYHFRLVLSGTFVSPTRRNHIPATSQLKSPLPLLITNSTSSHTLSLLSIYTDTTRFQDGCRLCSRHWVSRTPPHYAPPTSSSRGWRIRIWKTW